MARKREGDRKRDDSVGRTKQELRHLDVTPRKSRGQNFLQDPGFASELVNFVKIEPGDAVLEIGPGLGVLTESLLQTDCDLWVVELEAQFAVNLPKKLPKLSSERVLQRDIRDVRLEELSQKNFVVVGNVPYSISTDILFWVLKNRKQISRACFLLQREFAERIAAPIGSRESSAITLHRAIFADARLGPIITGDAFYPPTKVDSRLLYLSMLNAPRISDEKQEAFTVLVRAAFGQRRKTVVNSLLGSGLIDSKAAATEWFTRAGVDPGKRPEELAFDDFVRLLDHQPVC